MSYTCNMCDDQPPVKTWETEGRGWKFLCGDCFDWSSPIIQAASQDYESGRYYPTYDYSTRTVR